MNALDDAKLDRRNLSYGVASLIAAAALLLGLISDLISDNPEPVILIVLRALGVTGFALGGMSALWRRRASRLARSGTSTRLAPGPQEYGGPTG